MDDNACEFKMNDEVECKHGVGRVTYCEDGFMELRLHNGIEKNFFAPFAGKVWPYVKPVPVEELPLWTDLINHPAVAPHMEAVHDYQFSMSMIVAWVKGNAAAWSTLSDYQKANFLAVYSGCPLEYWREAFEAGRIEIHAQRWLSSAKAFAVVPTHRTKFSEGT